MMEIPSIFFSGIHAGIKEKGLDLGLVFFEEEMEYLALYTRNHIKAAHILYNKQFEGAPVRALLAISGCANAFTGKEGVEDLFFLSKKLSRLLKIKKEEILFASTGVIGKRLPLDRVVDALPNLIQNLSQRHIREFAESIMTTDTYPKFLYEEKKDFRFIGIAKGAGMINPLFATMLAFGFTDLPLPRERLERVFRKAVRESFERITVDGETSTNDSVFLFFKKGNLLNKGFFETLFSSFKRLSLMIVKDGEGATKTVHIIIKGVKRRALAEKLARRVARSPLVKTALFGCDPNVGRIVAALGDTSSHFDPEGMTIEIQGIKVASHGKILDFDEEELEGLLKKTEIEILVDLMDGKASFDIYTTDLGYDYIKVNASYRS